MLKDGLNSIRERITAVENLLTTEYNNEKLKIKQNQERLDRIENLLATEYGSEKLKIKQNQERLDNIEKLLADEYANEKLKIRQNQTRLDNLEGEARKFRRELNNIYNSSKDGDIQAKAFNFLNKTTNSQSGEDAILAYVVSRLGIPLENCSYLDLGANRPVEGSNTHFFYTQGAKGVLVEANPELIPALQSERPDDIVLNRCVDVEDGKSMEFIVMTDDGLSSPDERTVAEIQKVNPDIKVKSREIVQSITANRIFEEYFPKSPIICSIDIEGKDLEIIKSIDFSKYRPLLIVSEMIEYSNEIAIDSKRRDIQEFMISVDYKEYAFTGINSIFIDAKALKEKWGYQIL